MAKSERFTDPITGYNVFTAGIMLGSKWPVGALFRSPKRSLGNKEMIDRNVFERKVMILKGCLSLARVYHDQDNFKQSEFYTRLSSEYFEEILEQVSTT